jgi:hypothetical protein
MDQDLYNIYNKSVQNKGSVISKISNPFSGSPQIERDPESLKLEKSVFSRIAELTKDHDIPRTITTKSNNLRVVSFEEALKELVEMEKSTGFVESPPTS